jgi:hypothetical protein
MNEAEKQARLNIHPSTLREMEQAAPYHAMADLKAYGFAHSPCGIIPTNPASSQPARAPANMGGWVERPLVNPDNPQHPTASVAACDRLMDAADRADQQARQRAQAPDIMEQMATACTLMMRQQTRILAILAQLTNKEEVSPAGTASQNDRPKAKASASATGKKVTEL